MNTPAIDRTFLGSSFARLIALTTSTALPARARALLAALARTVDANSPVRAIFARRELLTGRALQSMRTFYRSLDDLEADGFITRPPQKRYGDAGLFGRAYLHLTTKAAALLGLVERSERSADNESVASASEEAAKTERAFSFAPPSVTVADGAIYKDLYPTTQKRQPGTPARGSPAPAELWDFMNF